MTSHLEKSTLDLEGGICTSTPAAVLTCPNTTQRACSALSIWGALLSSSSALSLHHSPKSQTTGQMAQILL